MYKRQKNAVEDDLLAIELKNDSKEIAELTAAVKKVAEMGEGLSNLSSGMVRDEIRKEVNDILSKAVSK